MKLSEIRAALKDAGYQANASVDRISVKYEHGKVAGIDVMLTDGGLAYIPITNAS